MNDATLVTKVQRNANTAAETRCSLKETNQYLYKGRIVGADVLEHN
jgi:hypothetical protein